MGIFRVFPRPCSHQGSGSRCRARWMVRTSKVIGPMSGSWGTGGLICTKNVEVITQDFMGVSWKFILRCHGKVNPPNWMEVYSWENWTKWWVFQIMCDCRRVARTKHPRKTGEIWCQNLEDFTNMQTENHFFSKNWAIENGRWPVVVPISHFCHFHSGWQLLRCHHPCSASRRSGTWCLGLACHYTRLFQPVEEEKYVNLLNCLDGFIGIEPMSMWILPFKIWTQIVKTQGPTSRFEDTTQQHNIWFSGRDAVGTSNGGLVMAIPEELRFCGGQLAKTEGPCLGWFHLDHL